jgi:hypothetical protein
MEKAWKEPVNAYFKALYGTSLRKTKKKKQETSR